MCRSKILGESCREVITTYVMGYIQFVIRRPTRFNYTELTFGGQTNTLLDQVFIEVRKQTPITTRVGRASNFLDPTQLDPQEK